MRHRRSPRPLAGAIGGLLAGVEPASVLAQVQRVWPEVAGPALAAQATPTAARDGVVTMTCVSAVWAQELDLMGTELVGRLNEALKGVEVRALRCRATPTRGWAGRQR